jgi:single-stranded-DNA-specific exonuclease
MRLLVDPCPLDDASRLCDTLGISRVLADLLVRRGLNDPETARGFLDLHGAQHDPFLLGDMQRGCDTIEAAIRAGHRIVVHGDYDVDGVCATVVATSVLTRLGGQVEPFMPSRFDEGYGVAVETVERLAADGVQLLVTVDCGITAVVAAARAAELGLAMVITDHHTPPSILADCPIVAPHGRGDYPAELCGTGVAYKLAEALVTRLGAPTSLLDDQLDLVALATIADMVPLTGENRGLVRAGLEALRHTTRPGLDALMRVARIDRVRTGTTDVSFRLAPRINAAGRLGHPREAYELLTTGDEQRAGVLADLLDRRNRERQAIESEILRDALAMVEALPADRRGARGIVLASSAWHVGVIGIVAARVAQRLCRPAVLIALDGDEGRGSGRSIPSFDLHAALAATSRHLVAFGGHRAAAGVTIRTDDVAAFTDAFAAYAETRLTDEDLVPTERIDAVLSLADVSLDLADELARLEPHGMANPAPRLLVPAVEVDQVTTLGQTNRHLRFTARSASGSCRVVWWSAAAEHARISHPGRYDLNCRVERNDWQGTSVVQLVARAVLAIPDQLDPPHDDHDQPVTVARPAVAAISAGAGPPRIHDLRDRGAYGELARLAASGEGLAIVCRNVTARRGMLRNAMHPARFGLSGAVVVSERCGEGDVTRRLVTATYQPTLILVDYPTLPLLGAAARRVAVLDPPLTEDDDHAVASLPATVDVYLVYGAREIAASVRAYERHAPRAVCEAVWRALESGPATIDQLAERAELHHLPRGDLVWATELLETAGIVAARDAGYQRAAAPVAVTLTDLPAFRERQDTYTRASERLSQPVVVGG